MVNESRNKTALSNGSVEDDKHQEALHDIAYIKRLIQTNQQKLNQSPPYLIIWGLYLMVGLLGMHFDTTAWPMWYWSIGALAASLASVIVGIKQPPANAKAKGGSLAWMFWVPFAVVMGSGCFMTLTDIVRMDYLSVFWLILIGITYVGMGSLFGKGPVVLGVWFIVLAVLTRLLFMDYQYMVLGIFGGGSLIFTGLFMRRRKEHE